MLEEVGGSKGLNDAQLLAQVLKDFYIYLYLYLYLYVGLDLYLYIYMYMYPYAVLAMLFFYCLVGSLAILPASICELHLYVYIVYRIVESCIDFPKACLDLPKSCRIVQKSCVVLAMLFVFFSLEVSRMHPRVC